MQPIFKIMAQRKLHLLDLPFELRTKIWNFAFGHTDAISPRRIDEAAMWSVCCYGCIRSSKEPQTAPFAVASAPLLTCRQMHSEAINIYRETLHVHTHLTSEFRFNQCSITSTAYIQLFLRNLSIRIHMGISGDADIQDDMRQLWLQRLTDLPERFPALNKLHITAHLRPPIAYENLVDAIYLAGPLSHLPLRIKLTMDFNYISEDVMIDHPELGRVMYSDALEEHTKVIEDCMADEIFCEGFHRSHPGAHLDVMTARLLQISQEHEQPWLMSLRRRKLERDQREAAENQRANGGRFR